MNWDELYQMQKNLDDDILMRTALTREEVLDEKILALLVEIGELANETRCFKYWSQKGPSESSVILEEFVDGIHFLLSIGIDYGYRYQISECIDHDEDLTTSFHKVYEKINRFKQNPTNMHYQKLMDTYLGLGSKLNFTQEDIFHAYLDKNKVNHQRQQSGY
ncbi:dUTP diphosphatase [Piscibacillus halophilus]|uniref:Dimeric dUTPase, all-alpha-NTP-PPase (MazG) superfamily n=1 Tax=Piscibacillus halophilus TaxID=571933 RepID=A0A1H9JAB3_9BACI|nr:dUTP diphosphatase [Piscibacillus halophilus]SEQ83713.1 Dimeric dUTPase, all-alpha-NTP-PPase (MazG) superfamily [Piscibacillus halophilus]